MTDLRATLAAPPPAPVIPLPEEEEEEALPVVTKAVIVSQWTSMLDLVEKPLDHEGLAYERLDGKLSQQARLYLIYLSLYMCVYIDL